MAGRDTPKGPETEAIESILEQLMQRPGNRALAILDLGRSRDQEFRDHLRYMFSRSRAYPLVHHLGVSEIALLSRVMGDAVAANLREYTRQFPTDYIHLFNGGVLNTQHQRRPPAVQRVHFIGVQRAAFLHAGRVCTALAIGGFAYAIKSSTNVPYA